MKTLIAAILLVLCAPIMAAMAMDVQQNISPSGQSYWLIQDNFVPVTSVSIAFDAGSSQDNVEAQGLSLLMADVMTEAAGSYDAKAFSTILNDHAISLSASASRDYITVNMRSLNHHRDQAVELLSATLTQARFDGEDVERIRQAHLSRLKNATKGPDWRASRLMLSKIYGADHPYGLNSGGTLTSLNAITIADIKARYRQAIHKTGMQLVIAGDIDAKQAGVIVDKITAGLPQAAALSLDRAAFPTQGGAFYHPFETPQASLKIIWPAPLRHEGDYMTARVLAHILGGGFGSRLMEEIREKQGLTYGIYASLMVMDHAGRFVVQTATQAENQQAIIDETHLILKDIASKGVTAQELSDAHNYLIGSYPLQLTSTDRLSGHFLQVKRQNLDADAVTQWSRDVRAVSARMIQDYVITMNNQPPVMISVGAEPPADGWSLEEILSNVE